MQTVEYAYIHPIFIDNMQLHLIKWICWAACRPSFFIAVFLPICFVGGTIFSITRTYLSDPEKAQGLYLPLRTIPQDLSV